MLSKTEQDRDDQQRRHSDTWLQVKNLEIQHRNATITAMATTLALVLSGSWWLSGKSADEKVGPVIERVIILETNYVNMVNDMQKMLKGQEKNYELLMELNRKK
jgi:hypothetical protein